MFSRKKKNETLCLWELTNISPFSTLLRPKFSSIVKGQDKYVFFFKAFITTRNNISCKCLRLRWEYPMGHKTAKRSIKSAYSYRIKYYRPMYREIYWQMSRPIYRPMSRPIYRWSIGEVLVKYRWTPTISTDTSVGRYIGRHPIDISTDTQPSIDRVAVDTRPILGWLSVKMSTDIAIDTSVAAPHKIHDPHI